MKVGSDLRNVYIWDTAREHLAALALKMMTEGQVGRKQSPVSLGDAASLAILEACERRGLDTRVKACERRGLDTRVKA